MKYIRVSPLQRLWKCGPAIFFRKKRLNSIARKRSNPTLEADNFCFSYDMTSRQKYFSLYLNRQIIMFIVVKESNACQNICLFEFSHFIQFRSSYFHQMSFNKKDRVMPISAPTNRCEFFQLCLLVSIENIL